MNMRMLYQYMRRYSGPSQSILKSAAQIETNVRGHTKTSITVLDADTRPSVYYTKGHVFFTQQNVGKRPRGQVWTACR